MNVKLMRAAGPIILGLVLLFAGALIAYLMVIFVLPTTWTLSLLSFASSMIGMVVGFWGLRVFIIERSKHDDDI